MNMNPTDCTKPTRCLVLDRHAEQKINAQGKEVKIVCSKKFNLPGADQPFFNTIFRVLKYRRSSLLKRLTIFFHTRLEHVSYKNKLMILIDNETYILYACQHFSSGCVFEFSQIYMFAKKQGWKRISWFIGIKT